MEMKLIYEPKVYLVGRQVVANDIDVFLNNEANAPNFSIESDAQSDGEELAEHAGRICYMSHAKPRPGGNAAYLQHIKEVGHGSVLEHSVWNFVFSGISRSLTHELVRHRSGFGYSQLSQRYVDESVAEYVVPPDLQEEVRAAESIDTDAFFPGCPRHTGMCWLENIRKTHEQYVFLADYLTKKAEKQGLKGTEARKFARQAARSVLPNATETKIFVTANARALRHFIEMRASRHADPEIRVLACKVWEVLAKEAPNLFGDYEKVFLETGGYELITKFRKV